MNKSFTSIHAKNLMEFIEFNQMLKKEYKNGIRWAHQLDLFAQNEISTTITKEFANRWGQLQENESEYNRYCRVSFLARFSNYLRDLGIESYIPKLPRKPPSTFVAHIYTKDEIQRLFDACENLKLNTLVKESCLISFPAMTRLLYATGIRSGEARSIKCCDINFEVGLLRIPNSKNGRERIIPISDSILEVLRQYNDFRNLLNGNATTSEYFFVKLNGKKCGKQSIQSYFRASLKIAGIPYLSGGLGPRIHDLRHTFAVHSLADMAYSGADISFCLPILSEYMGHKTTAATEGYVGLTMDMFPDFAAAFGLAIDMLSNPSEYDRI